MLIGIIIAIVSIIICILICSKLRLSIKKKNEEIDLYNTQQEQKYKEITEKLNKEKEKLSSYTEQIKIAEANVDNTNIRYKEATDKLENILATVENTDKAQKAVLESAFNSYCERLEMKYQEKDAEYAELTKILISAFDEYKSEIKSETAKIILELDNAKKARAALIEANRREQEIKDNSSFYCIEVSQKDLIDIKTLENVKESLSNPRILSMLIWQSYYQKPLKALSAKLLGAKTVTGIYKITNTITGECYIGQAVDMASRWADHCKCGLGIDTPVQNKLYKAMQKYGLNNFAFECLEECPSLKLNEREKNYIEFYQSCTFGYNSTVGNKSK